MSAADHIPDAALAVGAKTTSGMTYGGSAVAVWGGLTMNELGIIIGIVSSVAGLIGGLCIQWYWKRRHYLLAREKLELLKRGGADDE
ncbi:MAG: HP1 family phage holin [Thauera sp.]|jgi:hypothetical protein|nr:HP1 family phage holin [Thauera sp.]